MWLSIIMIALLVWGTQLVRTGVEDGDLGAVTGIQGAQPLLVGDPPGSVGVGLALEHAQRQWR